MHSYTFRFQYKKKLENDKARGFSIDWPFGKCLTQLKTISNFFVCNDLIKLKLIFFVYVMTNFVKLLFSKYFEWSVANEPFSDK